MEDKLFIGMKRDILTEEELNNAARTWTPETFIKFYSDLYGTMTMEEFRKFNLDIIRERYTCWQQNFCKFLNLLDFK